MIQLYAAVKTKVTSIDMKSMLAVGGSDSSGVSLTDLKSGGDYVIISFDGISISLHPLKGTVKGPLKLGLNQVVELDDLSLFAVERNTQNLQVDDESHFTSDLQELFPVFAEPNDLSLSMSMVLKKIVETSEMEKGLIILKNAKNDYEMVSGIGINPGDSWLSETLVQNTLRKQSPIVVQNIFGSGFDVNKSIMATGFISVMTWPLILRGECVGVALVGSQKPHSGLSDKKKKAVETFVSLGALMLWFHLRECKIREEMEALKSSQNKLQDSPILTKDPGLLDTLQTARKVAPSGLSVLIQGETGVGKELMAQWIHNSSDRSEKPFVAVNCGAIPAELLESTLFGHRKGAFTGAYADQLGKFQLANGGTLFLDELGDLPELLQVKLLRALQERTIEPLGSSKPMAVDVRIIAATHKSLSELVFTGKFREDLYFRMAEIVLFMPSLRDRPDDIVLLATLFLKEFDPDKRFSTQAWDWMKAQIWKGNVRELRSSVKRASVLSISSEISLQDLTKGQPSNSTGSVSGGLSGWLGGKDLEDAKFRFVQDKVRMALAQSGGQKNKAADFLGITSRTLFRYLEEMPEIRRERNEPVC